MKTPYERALEALELLELAHVRIDQAADYREAAPALETTRTLVRLARRELCAHVRRVEEAATRKRVARAAG